MINELDEALKQLLIREIPIRNSEVDLDFGQPGREWSARLNRPTLNLFLYDVRENQKLRQTQPAWQTERNEDGTVSQRRQPVRVDLHYLVTAWAADPEDEHSLLGRTMLAFFRFASLPPELLPESLPHQPKPIPILAAQYDELRNPTEVWQVLDNEMRPAVSLTVTVAMDPYQPLTVPPVRQRELRLGPSHRPRTGLLEATADVASLWTVGGRLRSTEEVDMAQVGLVLVERGQEVLVQPDGHFAISRLRSGDYTLEATVDGRLKRYPIHVPAPDYDLEL